MGAEVEQQPGKRYFSRKIAAAKPLAGRPTLKQVTTGKLLMAQALCDVHISLWQNMSV